MPTRLELFSGTSSIGKVFRARGWEVVSVDCDAKMQPTIVADIGTFDYKMLGGYFDAVWCSPPLYPVLDRTQSRQNAEGPGGC